MSAVAAASARGAWAHLASGIRRHKMASFGAGIVVLVALSALLAPWLAPHDPLEQDVLLRLAQPTADFPLGNDSFGRDILSRILWGGRVSLYVSTLAVKERDFVEAGRALGFSNLRLMVVHILPNVVDDILVMAALWLATAIRTEASLSFIGLGVRPPTATWGGMIREGFENILDSPWLAIFPSLAILVVMFGLNMLGDGLRDTSDPRLRHE